MARASWDVALLTAWTFAKPWKKGREDAGMTYRVMGIFDRLRRVRAGDVIWTLFGRTVQVANPGNATVQIPGCVTSICELHTGLEM